MEEGSRRVIAACWGPDSPLTTLVALDERGNMMEVLRLPAFSGPLRTRRGYLQEISSSIPMHLRQIHKAQVCSAPMNPSAADLSPQCLVTVQASCLGLKAIFERLPKPIAHTDKRTRSRYAMRHTLLYSCHLIMHQWPSKPPADLSRPPSRDLQLLSRTSVPESIGSYAHQSAGKTHVVSEPHPTSDAALAWTVRRVPFLPDDVQRIPSSTCQITWLVCSSLCSKASVAGLSSLLATSGAATCASTLEVKLSLCSAFIRRGGARGAVEVTAIGTGYAYPF